MTGPITRRRDIESLETAARWPGADRNTTVILAIRLAAARADAEGYRYFSGLAGARPGEALPLALAGFFQRRLGDDTDAALAKLDQAAAADLGPPQYFRGLALAGLPPDRRRAEQAIADLEFVLAVRDQFPAMLLRAAYHGLAAAHAVLGHDDQAAEAMRKSGLGAAPGRHPADVRRLLGHRRRRVAASPRPESSARNPVSRSPRATTSPTSRSSRPATASSRSTPAPPPTGSRPRSATLTRPLTARSAT